MKIKNHLLAGLALLSPLALSSCFDNDYDLSDLDTTVRLKTTDFVIPLNLDVLTLDQVIDIDEEDEDNVIVTYTYPNGERIYAINKGGEFESDPIKVTSFIIDEPEISPTEATLDLNLGDEANKLPDGVIGCYFILDVPPASFNAKTEDGVIDKAIHEIDGLGVNTEFTTTLKIVGLEALTDKTTLEEAIIRFPVGLEATYVDGKYSKAIDKKGVLDLSDHPLDLKGGELKITFDVDYIDVENSVKNKKINIDYDKRSLTFTDGIEIQHGVVRVRDVKVEQLPSKIDFSMQAHLGEIEVNSFSGKFEYDIDAFTIDPIDLTSLPDFLNQEGTSVKIENPQIYLSINNPLNEYDVEFESGFSLTTIDEKNKPYKTYEPDIDDETGKPYLIKIKSTDMDKDAEGNNEIVMVPEPELIDHYPEGYSNPEPIPFSGLRDLLVVGTGDKQRIPNTIEVGIKDPKMPEQQVTNFRLGETLSNVHGTFDFYAPLQLQDGSHIAYNDTINGWNDEDVDAISLSKVMVSFYATTELPYALELRIVPITLDDKPIDGVDCPLVTLGANADNEKVELSMIGEIKHLDGIIIKAKVINDGEEPLSPDMKLHIKDSKIILTGYFDKEL